MLQVIDILEGITSHSHLGHTHWHSGTVGAGVCVSRAL